MMAGLVRCRFGGEFGELRRAGIFAPGAFTIAGKREVYDVARIHGIAERTRANAARFPTFDRLPVKLGHTDAPEAQVGWLDPATLEVAPDGQMTAEVDLTEPDAAAKVARGTLRWVSVEMYRPGELDESTGEPIGEALRGLAIVPHPRNRQIRGMDVSFAEELTGARPVEMGEPMTLKERLLRVRDWLAGLLGREPTVDELADGVDAAGLSAFGEPPGPPSEECEVMSGQTKAPVAPEPTTPPAAAQWADMPPEVQAMFTEMAERTQAAEASAAEANRRADEAAAQTAELAGRAFSERVESRLEARVQAGFLEPARRDRVRAIALQFGDAATVRFAEDADPVNLLDALLELSERPVSAFGETARVEQNPGGTAARDRARAEAAEVVKRLGGGE
jgi:hypothetical protein